MHVNVIKHVKLTNIKILKIANSEIKKCEKRVIGKLVLECEDKILNTTKTSLHDKKETCKKIFVLFK